jgi:hypothetical protein
VPEVQGRRGGRVDLDAPALLEASGLAFSRQLARGAVDAQRLGPGRAAALRVRDATGGALGTYTLQGAEVRTGRTWPSGQVPSGQEYLYVGDIGDNNEEYASVTVYRAPEPPVDAARTGVMASDRRGRGAEFTYPGGAAHNAETLLVDPVSGDLYIWCKAAARGSPVFRAAAPLQSGALERGADARLGPAGWRPAGRCRPRVTGWSCDVLQRAHVVAAAGCRCGRPSPATPCTVPLAMEIQGEAIAFAAEGLDYFTVSEGETPPLFRFDSP